ncbi:hypothetical protein MLD38_001390 [Melastoma candidum]|uniref:Uncharacterized protein n=1 Tax=Melastoma candidum TaxID=119954 RepID=A0ACB9SI10_9MYRT|nr:hypothetical protein MLD38_001390 [Melastoma candidum]
MADPRASYRSPSTGWATASLPPGIPSPSTDNSPSPSSPEASPPGEPPSPGTFTVTAKPASPAPRRQPPSSGVQAPRRLPFQLPEVQGPAAVAAPHFPAFPTAPAAADPPPLAFPRPGSGKATFLRYSPTTAASPVPPIAPSSPHNLSSGHPFLGRPTPRQQQPEVDLDLPDLASPRHSKSEPSPSTTGVLDLSNPLPDDGESPANPDSYDQTTLPRQRRLSDSSPPRRPGPAAVPTPATSRQLRLNLLPHSQPAPRTPVATGSGDLQLRRASIHDDAGLPGLPMHPLAAATGFLLDPVPTDSTT